MKQPAGILMAFLGVCLLPLPGFAEVGVVTLYSFQHTSVPNGLTPGEDGNLYGTTRGESGWTDNGTVFRMSPQGDLTTLHAFDGSTGGNEPAAPLTRTTNGWFYGTTQSGGEYDLGTIFQIRSNGQFRVIASFDGVNGANPAGPLVLGEDGSLYGTATAGGPQDWGTVFKLDPQEQLTALVSFSGTNGAAPCGGLALGPDGWLYGTTQGAGGYGAPWKGTAFKVSLTGQLTNLAVFGNQADEYNPVAGLTLGPDGNWYGVTQGGGQTNGMTPTGYGTVFKVTPAGVLTTLASFSGGDGWSPQAALTLGADGDFYGVTAQGGHGICLGDHMLGEGAIFKVTSQGALTCLHSFTGWDDGREPAASLVQLPNGDFYGTTKNGGEYGNGTVYRVDFNAPPRPPVILEQSSSVTNGAGSTASFWAWVDGGDPLQFQWRRNGIDLSDGGNILGARTSTLVISNVAAADMGSYSVRVSNGAGATNSDEVQLTVFFPTATMNLLYAFGSHWDSTPGGQHAPDRGLTLARDGQLWGFSSGGVPQNAFSTGVGSQILRLTTNGALAAVHSFGLNAYAFQGKLLELAFPTGPLVQGADGAFYGMMEQAAELGTSGAPLASAGGVIFKVSPEGNVTLLARFTDGSRPVGSLLQAGDGQFYGLTQAAEDGGGKDAIFRLSPAGTLTTVYQFGAVTNANGLWLDGRSPSGGLTEGAGGVLYGTTSAGGTQGVGTIFKITLSGAFTSLYSFGLGGGSGPVSGVLTGADGTLYGTTPKMYGAFRGTVFKLTTNGTFTTLHAFSTANDGSDPGPLAWGPDGALYGATAVGGPSTFGTIFRVTPSGEFTVVAWHQFNPNLWGNQGTPRALVLGREGALYGVAPSGGPFGGGMVFQVMLGSGRPFFFNLPRDQAAPLTGTASFAAAVGGQLPISYRWQKGSLVLHDDDRISGATTGSLVISNVTAADAGPYTLTLSNELGMVTSPAVSLSLIQPAAPMQVLYAFNASENAGGGGNPWGGMVQGPDGCFYGTTLARRSLSEVGTVFRLGRDGRFTTLHQFGNTLNDEGIALDGAMPLAALAQGADGALYGTTMGGGRYNYGTVFKVTTAGAFTTLVSFDGTNGAMPLAGLTLGNDGNLYGTTAGGGPAFAYDSDLLEGEFGYGTVFRLTPSGSLSTVVAFKGTNGAYPFSPVLVGADGCLYGATSSGGEQFLGAVSENVQIDIALSFMGGFLPASMGYGTLFRVTSGGAFTSWPAFHGANGAGPVGALAQGPDGSLYGTVMVVGLGSTIPNGGVFKMSAPGVVTLLHAFVGTPDGAMPKSGLVRGPDQALYGTTTGGGQYGGGLVFKVAANDVVAPVYSFTVGLDGYCPAGALVVSSDGTFYGNAAAGGNGAAGALFQLNFQPVAPSLSIKRIGRDIWLSWPNSATNYIVEWTAEAKPGAVWTALTNVPFSSSGSLVVTNRASAPGRFFRLRGP